MRQKADTQPIYDNLAKRKINKQALASLLTKVNFFKAEKQLLNQKVKKLQQNDHGYKDTYEKQLLKPLTYQKYQTELDTHNFWR